MRASPRLSLALLEIANLTPALVVADRCAKAAGVQIVGIESTMGAEQCIKLAGGADDVREAGEQGVALARRMGTRSITGTSAKCRRDKRRGSSQARPPVAAL